MLDHFQDTFYDDQFQLKGSRIKQWGEAFNGRFYWCDAPLGYDEYGHNYATGRTWPYGHCIVDDYGTLQPADLFVHDHESEQIDHVICHYLDGWLGAEIENISLLEQMLHMRGETLIVDPWFNIYFVGYSYVSSDHVRLHRVRPGPWGNSIERLYFKDMPTAGFKFLLI